MHACMHAPALSAYASRSSDLYSLEQRTMATGVKTEIPRSCRALQASEGMPSGPGAEFLAHRIAKATCLRAICQHVSPEAGKPVRNSPFSSLVKSSSIQICRPLGANLLTLKNAAPVTAQDLHDLIWACNNSTRLGLHRPDPCPGTWSNAFEFA